ncbi:hypothetical protein HYV11_03040 [Candidatus Dependentiae bacterium]|nr:hypothetical protein [Candidatus Dependentiae bacterium]
MYKKMLFATILVNILAMSIDGRRRNPDELRNLHWRMQLEQDVCINEKICLLGSCITSLTVMSCLLLPHIEVLPDSFGVYCYHDTLSVPRNINSYQKAAKLKEPKKMK